MAEDNAKLMRMIEASKNAAMERGQLESLKNQYKRMLDVYNGVVNDNGSNNINIVYNGNANYKGNVNYTSKYDLDSYYSQLAGKQFVSYCNTLNDSLVEIETQISEIAEQTTNMKGSTNTNLAEVLNSFTAELADKKSLISDYTIPKCSKIEELITKLEERNKIQNSTGPDNFLDEAALSNASVETITKGLNYLGNKMSTKSRVAAIDKQCDAIIDEILKISDGVKVDTAIVTNNNVVEAAASSNNLNNNSNSKQTVLMYDNNSNAFKQVEVDSSLIQDARTYKVDNKTRSDIYRALGRYGTN